MNLSSERIEKAKCIVNQGQTYNISTGVMALQHVVAMTEGLQIQEGDVRGEKAVMKCLITQKHWVFIVTIGKEWIDLRACFDRPRGIEREILPICVNKWNENRRFSRMTLDEESDIWLRADIPIPFCMTVGHLQQVLKDAIHAFIAAMLEYQGFIVEESSNHDFRNTPKIDIDKCCERISCTEEHTTGRCVLCLDNFKVNDRCLKLPCGHMFHTEEIQKHLYQNPKCPLCRHSLLPDAAPQRTFDSLASLNLTSEP